MAAVAIQTGHYTLAKGIKTALRTNLDSIITTLSASVTDYLPAALQGAGANVYLSDLRLPPQAQQWLVMSLVVVEDARTLTMGQQNTELELTITAGVQGFTRARSGIDPAVTFEDATWQTAGLLSRAADHCLQRYLRSQTTVYSVKRLRTQRAGADPRKPNVCAMVSTHRVWMRTRASIGE